MCRAVKEHSVQVALPSHCSNDPQSRSSPRRAIDDQLEAPAQHSVLETDQRQQVGQSSLLTIFIHHKMVTIGLIQTKGKHEFN